MPSKCWVFLWGRKMPLPNILEFIGTNITQRKFQQAMEKLLGFTDELDKRQAATANGYYKSYATLSTANADIANIPLGVSVKVLNSADGGEYYKATLGATSLTKSPYDPLTQAKADATTKADLAEANAKSYTDLKVDDKFESSNNNDLFQFVDEDENIIARLSETGQLYLAGMSGSVQESMGGGSDASPKDVSLLRNLKVSDVFEPDALSLLSFANTQAIGSVVPAPFGIYKQRFDINSDWLNSFTMPVDPSYIPMETPYGNDRGVVHPHILEFPNGFNGWRYIVGLTGYTNGRTDEENPFLYGSNDLESFTLLTGLLDEPDVYTWEWGVKYNSDIVLAHDPISNELIVIWRRYEPITVAGAPSELKTRSYYYARRTRDLINFTEKELIWQNSTGNEIDALSPAFIYEASTDTWHLFACGGSSNVDGIRHFTNSELKEGWVFQNYITMNTGSRAWHIDARWVGKKIVLLVQERQGDNSGSGLRFGVQDTENDFVNFTWADNFFNTSGVAVYKGTFAPEFNSDGQMRLNILWTYGPGSTSPYKFLKHTTAYFDAGRTN